MTGQINEQFAPKWSCTLPYTSTAASVTFSTSQIPDSDLTLKIYNSGTGNVYLAGGSSGVAAVLPSSGVPALNCAPFPPSYCEALSFVGNTLSAISSAGVSGTLYISDGYGQ